jgi:S-adenosylmethionine:tRNA ribosyltransferase-isomerase
VALFQYSEKEVMDVKKIRIADYNYSLPDERIAKHPLEKRDQSKLLVYKNSRILSDIFKNIDNYLPNNSMLILNNTRVVRARLKFTKATGANIEIFLIEPVEPSDYTLSFSSKAKVTWKCIVGNIKRWKSDDLQLKISGTSTTLTAKMLRRLSEGAEVEFSWNDSSLSFAEIIELCGKVPIPPYLNRDSEDIDSYRYQTIYAQPEGSVAAPTAGLHFTDEVFKKLKGKGIEPSFVTLHVGAGTFKPVTAETIDGHEMHTEHFFVDIKMVEKLWKSNEKVTCVGTTTLRTVESIYWLGVKAAMGLLGSNFFVGQWEPYELDADIKPKDAFKALYDYMRDKGLEALSASTQIIIAPGYTIKSCDILITNFHQPRSTLLLLVAAAVGESWKSIYQYALENDFRFLSYGDSSILFVNK